VPTDGECGLVVGDETRLVEENKILPFNETTTHYAYNRSEKNRGVLIVSYLDSEL
ncbi:MAG: aspartyl/asparaginyl beta-hydroxylase domain-containing protein, partial [Paracoccaceae bacterium]